MKIHGFSLELEDLDKRLLVGDVSRTFSLFVLSTCYILRYKR